MQWRRGKYKEKKIWISLSFHLVLDVYDQITKIEVYYQEQHKL